MEKETLETEEYGGPDLSLRPGDTFQPRTVWICNCLLSEKLLERTDEKF